MCAVVVPWLKAHTCTAYCILWKHDLCWLQHMSCQSESQNVCNAYLVPSWNLVLKDNQLANRFERTAICFELWFENRKLYSLNRAVTQLLVGLGVHMRDESTAPATTRSRQSCAQKKSSKVQNWVVAWLKSSTVVGSLSNHPHSLKVGVSINQVYLTDDYQKPTIKVNGQHHSIWIHTRFADLLHRIEILHAHGCSFSHTIRWSYSRIRCSCCIIIRLDDAIFSLRW